MNPQPFALLVFFCTTLASSILIAATEQPNVVLIISDDQGWRDYGFMGHEVIQTPRLDELARQSLVFEHGYVPSPLCRPSLASIITGLYPHQHGILANDVEPQRRVESDEPLRARFQRLPNLARTLVANGYLAFQSGKWWEGAYQDGGFTHGMTHGDPKRRGRHGDAGLEIGRTGMQPLTDFIDGAVARQKPFFVWYAPFLPHTPHNPPTQLLEKYKTPNRPENVAKYYAMCEWFDQTCGELLDCLDAQRVRKNTIVLYVTDNGWAPVDRTAGEESSAKPKGWWPDFAPKSKGSPYEIGVRTPIMVSWPSKVLPAWNDALASSIDLMPTALAACGIDSPESLPGIDLLDARSRNERDAVFGGSWSVHNMTVGDPSATLQYRWCVTPKWKFLLRHSGLDTTRYRVVHNWDEQPAQLYLIREDPGEANNLIAQHPQVIQKLTAKIDDVIPSP